MKIETEYYKCPQCGLLWPVIRKKGQTKEKGHMKYLWCPNCPNEERINFKKVEEF